MPPKNWKSITIKESIYDELDRIAREKNLSIPKVIELIFEKYREDLMKHEC